MYIFHGLAVGACLGEVFLSALAREDCLAVASEALWPEVTKVCPRNLVDSLEAPVTLRGFYD